MWWSKGAETILRLLEEHRLERIQGAQADGHSWLARAERKLEDARTMVPDSPDSSFTLAYDAARLACTAVLVQQGLRPTNSGGHYAVDEAIRAQFGYVLRSYGALRRRRNELQYPLDPAAEATAERGRRRYNQGREPHQVRHPAPRRGVRQRKVPQCVGGHAAFSDRLTRIAQGGVRTWRAHQ